MKVASETAPAVSGWAADARNVGAERPSVPSMRNASGAERVRDRNVVRDRNIAATVTSVRTR